MLKDDGQSHFLERNSTLFSTAGVFTQPGPKTVKQVGEEFQRCKSVFIEKSQKTVISKTFDNEQMLVVNEHEDSGGKPCDS